MITLVLTRFARLDVPETFSEDPCNPVPVRVIVVTLVLMMLARFEVPSEFKDPTLRLFDMYTLPFTSNSVFENRAPSI